MSKWQREAAVDTPSWDGGDISDLPGGEVPAFPVLAHDTTADLCVVGLGGSGLAAIGAALARGLDVVGLDAATVGGGAAGRNGGFLLAGLADFHHVLRARLGRERAGALYRATAEEIDRIAAASPTAVRRTGSLRIAVDAAEATDIGDHLAALHADGLPGERHDGREGRGLRVPGDAAMDPLARCRHLATTVHGRGARLFERSPVTGLGQGAATTAAATVRAPAVVVAVDGLLEVVLPELADRVRSVRLQALATAPTEEVALPRPVYARYGLDWWQQCAQGRIVLGGCRDAGGAAEVTTLRRPTDAVQAALESVLRHRVGVTAPVTHRWAGIVGFSTDRLPVIAEVRPGVWATGGYCGTGNVVGALCGRAAVDLALGGPSAWAELVTGSVTPRR